LGPSRLKPPAACQVSMFSSVVSSRRPRRRKRRKVRRRSVCWRRCRSRAPGSLAGWNCTAWWARDKDARGVGRRKVLEGGPIRGGGVRASRGRFVPAAAPLGTCPANPAARPNQPRPAGAGRGPRGCRGSVVPPSLTDLDMPWPRLERRTPRREAVPVIAHPRLPRRFRLGGRIGLRRPEFPRGTAGKPDTVSGAAAATDESEAGTPIARSVRAGRHSSAQPARA
jgi:hypothetical protein